MWTCFKGGSCWPKVDNIYNFQPYDNIWAIGQSGPYHLGRSFFEVCKIDYNN